MSVPIKLIPEKYWRKCFLCDVYDERLYYIPVKPLISQNLFLSGKVFPLNLSIFAAIIHLPFEVDGRVLEYHVKNKVL